MESETDKQRERKKEREYFPIDKTCAPKIIIYQNFNQDVQTFDGLRTSFMLGMSLYKHIKQHLILLWSHSLGFMSLSVYIYICARV